MTNDKSEATYHQPFQGSPANPAPKKKTYNVGLATIIAAPVVLLLMIGALAFNMVHDNNIITARDKTISSQKADLRADKAQIGMLKDSLRTTEGQRDDAQDRAENCAAARDAWNKVTVDTYTYLSDVFNDATGDYTSESDQISQEITDAKTADQKCLSDGNQA